MVVLVRLYSISPSRIPLSKLCLILSFNPGSARNRGRFRPPFFSYPVSFLCRHHQTRLPPGIRRIERTCPGRWSSVFSHDNDPGVAKTQAATGAKVPREISMPFWPIMRRRPLSKKSNCWPTWASRSYRMCPSYSVTCWWMIASISGGGPRGEALFPKDTKRRQTRHLPGAPGGAGQ